MKIRMLLVLGGAWVMLLAGCRMGPCGPSPVMTTRYSLADTAKVMLLDKTVQESVECTGLQVSHHKDGRLEVIVSLKNLSHRTVPVQVDAMFKGPAGEALGDETPWHWLTLEGNNTVVARFVSKDDRAADFAVQVRAAK
ncbi:MAG TPA: hypothetical protein VL357_05335 [Rariglobus sp.]|jgi:hypothetical protein|nr:hypothetical protein [Rariglobus sp.]